MSLCDVFLYNAILLGLLGFRRNFMTFSMIVIPIGVIAAVTAAILLVVGSVLSTQNG